MKKVLFLLCLLAALPGFVQAQVTNQIAEGPSSVKFRIKHLLFTNVEGEFKNFQGSVISNGSDMTGAVIEATIDTKSIYTGIQDRDSHLKSKTFFDSEKFPEMTFTSTKVERVDEDEECYRIIGELRIKDVSKTIELIADCTKVKTLANGQTRMNFEAKGRIHRSDYGLNWNEYLDTKMILGEEVEIILSIALMA